MYDKCKGNLYSLGAINVLFNVSEAVTPTNALCLTQSQIKEK